MPAVFTVWGIYLIGLGPTLFGRVFGRGHLVLKNTRLLMIAGIANFGLKVVLNLALIRPLGLYGLVLSTTLTYSAVALVLMLSFLKVPITAIERFEEQSYTIDPGAMKNGQERVD